MFCIHDSLLITFSRCKNSSVLHPLDILRIAAYIKFYRRNRSVLLIKNKTLFLRGAVYRYWRSRSLQQQLYPDSIRIHEPLTAWFRGIVRGDTG